MNVINVDRVTKIYRLYHSPKDRLREIFSLTGKTYHNAFHALHDVSLSIEKGQTVGIIGMNGSGKSTLLKLICDVLKPTSGNIQVKGRVAALLELGAGFNPEFSGRDNVFMNGALQGFGQAEMEQRIMAIESFAGIADFIDQPVKTYSSGMYVRLAFAAAVNVDPDILIVDEALSVGDALFQAKCYAKFEDFKKMDKTIVFVTHDLSLITSYCERAILLHEGKIELVGNPKEVVDHYNRLIVSKSSVHQKPPIPKDHLNDLKDQHSSSEKEWGSIFKHNPDGHRYGNRKAEVLEAGIFNLDHTPTQILQRNHEYLIKVKVRHNYNMPAAITAFAIKNPKGTILCGTNTFYEKIHMEKAETNDVRLITFRQKITMNPGEYLLSVGVAAFEADEYVVYDRRFDYLPFHVTAEKQYVGLFDPESIIEWTNLNHK